MKNKFIYIFIFLGLSLSLSFCKKNEFADLIKEGEHPFGNTTGGEIAQTKDFDKDKSIVFKIPNFYTEWNIFLKNKGTETFLTNFCNRDCNEEINKSEWSKDGLYFAMLIENSDRYPNTTRLFLFNFHDDIVTRKVDVSDKKIISFRLEEKAFFYTDNKNNEIKINL